MYENGGFLDLGVRSSFIKTTNKHYYQVHKSKVFSVTTMTEKVSKYGLVSKFIVIKGTYVMRV